MAALAGHDRLYLQSRLREELARAKRFGHEFALLVFEMVPSSDGLLPHKKLDYGLQVLNHCVRACDTAAYVYDDTLAALLVETDAWGAKDALQRVRNLLQRHAGTWQVTVYHFPEHEEAIGALPLLSAA